MLTNILITSCIQDYIHALYIYLNLKSNMYKINYTQLTVMPVKLEGKLNWAVITSLMLLGVKLQTSANSV